MQIHELICNQRANNYPPHLTGVLTLPRELHHVGVVVTTVIINFKRHDNLTVTEHSLERGE